jgi:hypothetical protein
MLWFDLSTTTLKSWSGIAWIIVGFVTSPITFTTGHLWYDTTNSILKKWTGENWVVATPKVTIEIDCHGNLLFTHTRTGSLSYIGLTDGNLFQSLTQEFKFHSPRPGTDGASDIPSYSELDVGTDGTNDERFQLHNEIRYELGYPVVDVELTPEQLDYVIDKALGELRSRSSVAYKRGYFFMQIHANTQRYLLTNKVSGMNKIVDILGVYRTTSAFLSSAHGAGVYGQIILQHLYQMGSFDLLSYHIMAEYTKLMEMLFAARLTFNWNEQKRELWIHHKFPLNEKMVCIDAAVERTEQDLLTDRYTRAWLRRYSLATARLILAETRGKYQSLPGAGGSLSLNASDLRMASQQEIDRCIAEIEDYTIDSPIEYGLGSTITMG